MKTDVIILAGGLGERLRHTVNNRQKTMAPVKGKPFLDYLCRRVCSENTGKIIFAVSYRYEDIKDYFGDGLNGIKIEYSVENEPLGTGGAIKRALGMCGEKTALVLNGDTLFDISFDSLTDFHSACGAEITVAGRSVEDASRYGTAAVSDDGRLLAFSEKKEGSSGLINGGVYVIEKSILPLLPDGKFSFEKEILEKNACRIFMKPCGGYFIDIGIPSDYFRAQTEIPLLFGENEFKAAFLDRDGVICKEKHHLYKTEDFEFIPGAAEGIALLKSKGYLVIVVTNQAGVAKGLYTENDVAVLHEHMLGSLSGGAYIDAVYYCPFHPDGTVEKYRKISDCRKPAPGMLEKAVADFGRKGIIINPGASVMIGDTEKDILTGKNAGTAKNILVRSGHPIPDESQSKADMICNNLLEAAEML